MLPKTVHDPALRELCGAWVLVEVEERDRGRCLQVEVQGRLSPRLLTAGEHVSMLNPDSVKLAIALYRLVSN